MDQLRECLEAIREQGAAQGNLLGLLNILIGRRITTVDGTAVSAGMTWRELAALLKKLRWDREQVRELGLDPAELPPRDRQRFWYTAISQANLNSAPAATAGDRLVATLHSLGFEVGPAPKGKK